MAEPKASRYTDIVPAKKTVIGSSVVDARNEDLGKSKTSFSTLEPGGLLTQFCPLEGF